MPASADRAGGTADCSWFHSGVGHVTADSPDTSLVHRALSSLGVTDVAVRQPQWAAALATNTLRGVLFDVQTRRRVVALTFDDGPDRVVTPALLDVLARHRATATFFLIGGKVAGNDATLRRIAAEGHELAAHGMDATPSVRKPRAAFERDLVACVERLSRWGPVRYFRPASGWIRADQLSVVRRHGLTCALGTITLVRDPIVMPRRAAGQLDRRIRPGAIVVLHEGTAERASVIDSVDLLLSRLSDRGYAAVGLSELETYRGP